MLETAPSWSPSLRKEKSTKSHRISNLVFSQCVAFALTCLSLGEAEKPTSLLPSAILASIQDVLSPDLFPGRARRNWEENGRRGKASLAENVLRSRRLQSGYVMGEKSGESNGGGYELEAEVGLVVWTVEVT